MPAHLIDANDPKNLARILVCLVIEHGGELRMKGVTFDSLDKGRILLLDYDRVTAEVVLRVTSDLGRALVVPPESYAWTQPAEIAPREQVRIQAQQEVQRQRVRSDEELADLEEKMNAKSKLAEEARSGTLPRQPFRNIPPSESAR